MYGYNLETETKKEMSSMNRERSKHGSCIFKKSYETFLLVAGGHKTNNDNIMCEFLKFDKNEWQSLPDLNGKSRKTVCGNWDDFNSIVTFHISLNYPRNCNSAQL